MVSVLLTLTLYHRLNDIIPGNVKISFPDPENPGYNRYFVRMTRPDIALEDTPTQPEHLTIPVEGIFQLTVEHVRCSVTKSVIAAESDL